MELTVKKEDLVKGTAKAQAVAETRHFLPTAPDLAGVLLEAEDDRLRLSATDMETSISRSCPAQVTSPGRLVVPARKLHQIVKELPGDEVRLKEKENHHLHISAGRANYNLMGAPAEDFPETPQAEDMPEITLDAEVLAEMIDLTFFSICQDYTRFNLGGTLVEKKTGPGGCRLRFVSTDGHRLSLVERQVPGLESLSLEEGVVIPRKGVAEMRKMAKEGGEITLGLSDSLATARRDGEVLIQKMAEGRFPEYQAVIPKEVKHDIAVDRQAFGEVLRRISLMSADRHGGVHLNFNQGLLEVVSQNPETGKARETLEADYAEEPFKVGFNARYLLDLCNAMSSEKITLGFVDEHNPCLVRGEDDPGFLAVVMPMVI